MVPTSVNDGCSGGGGAGSSCFCGGGATGAATIGGRRDAENNGRSRVPVSALSGITHNGLPVRCLALRLGAGRAGGLKSARASVGSAARAAKAEAITRKAANSRITLMDATAQRP